jgi:hypothetical protein
VDIDPWIFSRDGGMSLGHTILRRKKQGSGASYGRNSVLRDSPESWRTRFFECFANRQLYISEEPKPSNLLKSHVR